MCVYVLTRPPARHGVVARHRRGRRRRRRCRLLSRESNDGGAPARPAGPTMLRRDEVVRKSSRCRLDIETMSRRDCCVTSACSMRGSLHNYRDTVTTV
ncbi:hypothetical protein EVAR_43893_1 [Eumeta japonica]|uniref:Uncharacterized protein n=1 Tax=Eumeta variegata TaxID=151549 RepID=A0A4C1WQ94_EUMVA|nr:hypothetical protein EVAR_43893_1 [Eumeta japonica]